MNIVPKYRFSASSISNNRYLPCKSPDGQPLLTVEAHQPTNIWSLVCLQVQRYLLNLKLWANISSDYFTICVAHHTIYLQTRNSDKTYSL